MTDLRSSQEFNLEDESSFEHLGSVEMSDQNEFALVPNPYEVSDQTKNLANNQHLSDVTFLVGDEKRLIYAHRFVLALGNF